VPEQLGIGEFSTVCGNVGFLYRKFPGRIDLRPVHFIELVVEVVEEEFLPGTGLAEHQNGGQAERGLMEDV